MQFEDMTPEQLERLRACKSKEEFVELVKSEGFELSEGMLDGLAGGRKCVGYENPFPVGDCPALEDYKKWYEEWRKNPIA